MNAENRLLTLEEACAFLGVSKLTVYGWTSARKIPFRKVGRLLRFSRVELENWTRQPAIGRSMAIDPRRESDQ